MKVHYPAKTVHCPLVEIATERIEQWSERSFNKKQR